jgi:hypothetical protein
LRVWKFPAPVLRVCFSPDGKYVATANKNGFVYILRR